jgi:hypothetical protein
MPRAEAISPADLQADARAKRSLGRSIVTARQVALNAHSFGVLLQPSQGIVDVRHGRIVVNPCRGLGGGQWLEGRVLLGREGILYRLTAVVRPGVNPIAEVGRTLGHIGLDERKP